MRYDHHRRIPWQGRVRIPVEMNHGRFDLTGDIEQPLAGPLDVVPGIVHPLEPVWPVQQIKAGVTRLTALLRAGGRPHHRDRHVHIPAPERGAKIDGVLPNAADGIGGHHYAGARHADLEVATGNSSSSSRRGFVSWMSLNSLKRARYSSMARSQARSS